MRNRLLLMARKRLVPGASAIYLFNEGTGTVLTDRSGNGNHGTLGAGAAAPTWGATGLTFDGGDNVDCGAAFRGLGAGFTAQVAALPTTNAYQGLVGNNSSGGATGLGWLIQKSIDANAFRARVFDGNGNVVELTIPANPTGTWSLITLVYDGTTIRGYSGTTATAPAACVGLSEVTAQNLRIGAHAYTAILGFTGTVGAVTVYPYAFAATHVAQNATAIRALLAPRGVTIA